MSPRRRNLLGHLNDRASRDQVRLERELRNVERAPTRSEQIFVTPEEARRRRKRLYQNYFGGSLPPQTAPSGYKLYGLKGVFTTEDFLASYEVWEYTGEAGDNGWHQVGIINEPSFDNASVDLSVRATLMAVRESSGVMHASYTSEDEGATWTGRALLPFLDALDVADSNRLIAIRGDGTDEELMYSDDLGMTWTEVDVLPDGPFTGKAWGIIATNPAIEGLVVIPYMWGMGTGLRQQRVAISENNGETYTHFSVASFASNLLSPGRALILNSGRILISFQEESTYLSYAYSDDLGVTWTSITRLHTKDVDEGSPLFLTWAAIDDRVFGFPCLASYNGKYYISDDSGESFEQYVMPIPASGNSGIHSAARFSENGLVAVIFANLGLDFVYLLSSAGEISEPTEDDWQDITPSTGELESDAINEVASVLSQ